jgi:hypothetical protein
MERPVGVTVVAAYFLLAGVYGCAFCLADLVSRGAFELPRGAPFFVELEIYGPYCALLAGSVCLAVGWGVLKLRRWARWGAMLGMVLGIQQLVMPISMTKTERGLFWYGILIALHAAAGFYLAQSGDVLDAFEKGQ